MASLIPEDLAAPGTHALVIGVSRYLHFADGSDPTPQGSAFQMDQLSGAARSASEFAAWLRDEYLCTQVPLKSLRVLLSPSPGEPIHPRISELLARGEVATLANARAALNEFRQACNVHRDNIAIVYVAGHGVQLTKNGAILMLSDFGDTAHLAQLEGALDMAGIHAGMNHPATARTQFWFVDACRQRPTIAKRFESLEGALKLDVPVGDTETSPLFLAATTGTPAYARHAGLTLFAEALLWSLRGGAATGPEDDGVNAWHVPVTALIRRLPDRVQELAAAENAEQSVDIAGKVHEATLQEFAVAPQVDLRIDVEPAPARPVSRGTLTQGSGQLVVAGYSAWPFHQPVEAGLYSLNIQADPPFTSRSDILNVRPPALTKGYTV